MASFIFQQATHFKLFSFRERFMRIFNSFIPVQQTFKIFSLVLLVFFVFAPPVWADDSRIGFVDLQKAVSSTREWKTSLQVFRKSFENEKGVITAREEKIKKKLADLNKKSFVLSPDLKNKKENEFRKSKRDFERYVQDRNEEFGKKEKEITNKIIQKMVKVLQKLGKEKKYTVIFDQKIGLYFDKAHDLTNLAVSTYNKMDR